MAQREYEDQPQAPDLGEMVQEDNAETLVGPSTSDPLDAGYVPPDRPYLLEDEAARSAEPEDLEGRLRRERPDIDPDDPDAAVTALDPDAERAPRLESSEQNPDGTNRGALDAEDVGLAGGAASAEEASVHLHDSR